ncbi:MAG TPA: membrane-bound lytic murein transglycosylase MltF [Rhodocyclaceae bacterium]
MRQALSCLLALILAGCSFDSTVDIHTRSDELVVALRELPTSYQPDGLDNGRGGKGFEYDLLSMLAEHLGKPLRVIPLPSENDVLRYLRHRRSHLGAAWLSVPVQHPDAYWASRSFFESQPVIVQNVDDRPVTRPEDLVDRVVAVRAGSPLANRLLSGRYALVGGAAIAERPDYTGLRLIRAVADGKVPVAAVELPQLDLARTFLPDVQATLTLGDPREIVWLMQAGFDPELQIQINLFLEAITTDGRLERIFDRYFGHVRRLNRYDTVAFITRIRTVLPRFNELFWKAEASTGIDWRLIAALSYQESHWDPLATSKTGVRGIMMLTGDTADRMGVKNRLDPTESIRGGAEYLALLRDGMPDSIVEPDRTFIAIAAYNVGMAHIYSARRLARLKGLNPDLWHELRRVLPLLSRAEYYNTLPTGRARGGETVIMVENIRAFYDILRRNAPPYETFAEITARPPPQP